MLFQFNKGFSALVDKIFEKNTFICNFACEMAITHFFLRVAIKNIFKRCDHMLNVRELVEVVEWNKKNGPLPSPTIL